MTSAKMATIGSTHSTPLRLLTERCLYFVFVRSGPIFVAFSPAWWIFVVKDRSFTSSLPPVPTKTKCGKLPGKDSGNLCDLLNLLIFVLFWGEKDLILPLWDLYISWFQVPNLLLLQCVDTAWYCGESSAVKCMDRQHLLWVILVHSFTKWHRSLDYSEVWAARTSNPHLNRNPLGCSPTDDVLGIALAPGSGHLIRLQL